MSGDEQLTLQASLDEMSRLLPWVERLAANHAIPETVQFSIHVCLEEAVSNVIRHGYSERAENTLTVRFLAQPDRLLFVIDDAAPRFSPLEQPEQPALTPDTEMRVGGQGLRMLRQFADSLEYEETPTGNRLKIGFSRNSGTDPD
jgi:serine/threonine-protein kinase RsbW